jgi:hypothetical protein
MQRFSTPPLLLLIMRMTNKPEIMGEAVNRPALLLGGLRRLPVLRQQPGSWSPGFL